MHSVFLICMSIRFFPELCRIFPAYLFGPTPLSFGWKSYHRFSLTPVRSESRRSLLRDTSANDNRIWCLATPSRFLDKQIREITTFNFIDINRVFIRFFRWDHSLCHITRSFSVLRCFHTTFVIFLFVWRISFFFFDFSFFTFYFIQRFFMFNETKFSLDDFCCIAWIFIYE